MAETSPNAPKRLLSYLRGSVGRSLRTVIRYHQDGYERLYADGGSADEIRAALSQAESGAVAPAVHSTLGARRGTIECHEDVVLVHLPEGEARGTLLTADPDALPELYDLLGGMHRHLPAANGADHENR